MSNFISKEKNTWYIVINQSDFDKKEGKTWLAETFPSSDLIIVDSSIGLCLMTDSDDEAMLFKLKWF